MQKKLFLDMDGTLSQFFAHAKCIEKMSEQGFFADLDPYINAVEAVKKLKLRGEELEVCILSAISNLFEEEEKKEWIQRYIGDIPVYFCKAGSSKADYILQLESKECIPEDYFLLDDYSKNLLDWKKKGGTPIKFRNELNGRGWNGSNFNGHTVYYDQKPDELAHDILSVMKIIPETKISYDEPANWQQMRYEIDKAMETEFGWHLIDGQWTTEIYADYRDCLDKSEIEEIFRSAEPSIAFHEKLYDMYEGHALQMEAEAEKAVRRKLGKLGCGFATDGDGRFQNPETEEIFQSILEDGIFCVEYPADHFRKQELCVNIMIDTGDRMHNFTDNATYPFLDAFKEAEIPGTASIAWLAGTQGVSREALKRRMNAFEDDVTKKGFVDTLGLELINMSSNRAVLTFLVRMTLGQALALSDAMFAFPPEHDDPRYISIGKGTRTGLYDDEFGIGSLFGIELEQDVKVPIGIIHSAKPDGCEGNYSVAETCDLDRSAWKDTLTMNIRWKTAEAVA